MLTKESVKQVIDHMPETFSVDDLVEEMMLLDKINRARLQIANGEYYTEEEMKKEIDSWFED
ncbi:hypothetical protein [Mucilaginibacter ginkgonis]|uniref:Uncharacterized protein n=1 Tax=Mucilaginibacter ginkgonis TaxID=2682091 RepID=A0A6I4INU7_9SPHI|nr:hypothetical protein [Mucilaginibacter ginkgonis]QQL48866.1 hypothetical protein GO620_011825 [Mucilaginibacter ginkgonis]